MKRGRFITFEGGEGSGKSTQVQRLVAYFNQTGQKTIATREVGGCPSAELIRALWLDQKEGYWDPMTELLLIMAARREHLVRAVWPALDQGIGVVSDRFVDSTRAYQGMGQGLGLDKVDALYRDIAGDFVPDQTFLLDLPANIGLGRVAQRGDTDDRYQQKDPAFHEALRESYLSLATKEPKRFRVINADDQEESLAKTIIANLADHSP